MEGSQGPGDPPGISFLKGCLMNEPSAFTDKSRQRQEKAGSSNGQIRIQQSIARGYDDLINGRVRPWKQAKAEADRMRALSQALPPCNHPVNHSVPLGFYRDAVAPGAALC